MNQPPEEDRGPDSGGPLPLDALAYGIDLLDAILVFHLGDAQLHAAWVRPDTGLRADDMVASLRDAYRVCQFTARRVAHQPGAPDRRGDVPSPIVTIEIAMRTAILRRIRAFAVVTLFDASMPLGMARLVAARIAAALEPELPLGQETAGHHEPAPPARVRIREVVPPPTGADTVLRAPDLAPDDQGDIAPATLAFGTSRPRRTPPPPPRATPTELERTRRLLAYFDAHAPEPHVARHRLALRAGLTLVALAHPEAFGPEAMVLIETAVEDILGLDRAELRRSS